MSTETNNELLKSVSKWQQHHETEDVARFERIEKRLDELPQEIKERVNGSVERTVNKQMWGFMRWMGLGGFILLISMGIAWGNISNQVKTNTENLDGTLNEKDFALIQTQLIAQTAAIGALQTDISFIKNNLNK